MKRKTKQWMGTFLIMAAVAGHGAAADGPTVSGYVDFGYNYNFNGQRSNVLRIFDANANSFTLQNAEIDVAGKTSDNVTYQVDVLYGNDAGLTHSGGFVTTSTSTVSANTLVDLQQAFVAFPCSLSGGTWTVGKFNTPHGAEVVEAKDDFNISRGILNYGMPFTHIGLKYNRAFGSLDLTGGVVNGWDKYQDNNNSKSLQGSVGYAFSPALKTVVNATYGPERDDDEKHGRSLLDALVTIVPSDKLTLVVNALWGVQEGTGMVTPSGKVEAATWSGAGLLGSYAVNEKNSIGFRIENMADDGFAFPVTTPDVDGKDNLPVSVTSYTATLQHKDKGVIYRLEYRGDASNKKIFTDSKGVAVKTKNQSTVGAQIIYTF